MRPAPESVPCPSRRSASAKRSREPRARAGARPSLSPLAEPAYQERASRAGLRRRRRLLLDLLLLPGRCAVSLGGGCRSPAATVAAAVAPRRGHRPHLGTEGRAAREAPRVLRQAAQGPPAA